MATNAAYDWPTVDQPQEPSVEVVSSRETARYDQNETADQWQLPSTRRDRSSPYRVNRSASLEESSKRVGRSFIGHIVLASFAVIACLPFGLVALWLALTARTRIRSDIDADRKSADRRAVASLCVSASGFLVTVIIVIVAVSVATSGSTPSADGLWSSTVPTTTPYVFVRGSTVAPRSPAPCTDFTYNGNCYAFKIVWNESDVLALLARHALAVRNDSAINVTTANVTTDAVHDVTGTTVGGVTTVVPTTAAPLSPLLACRFGVPNDTDPWTCYYDQRVDARGGAYCAGDWYPGDEFCYTVGRAHCPGARNYYNGLCYAYLLPVDRPADCRHGYYNSAHSTCYYDASFLSADPTCGGYSADRGAALSLGDDGHCYFTSPNSNACPFAANFVQQACYRYVVPGLALRECSNGVYAHGNCYYMTAVKTSSGTCKNPSSQDQLGDYCYSKS